MYVGCWGLFSLGFVDAGVFDTNWSGSESSSGFHQWFPRCPVVRRRHFKIGSNQPVLH